MVRARSALGLSSDTRLGPAQISVVWHRVRELAQDEPRDEQHNEGPAMKGMAVHLPSVSPSGPSRNRGAAKDSPTARPHTTKSGEHSRFSCAKSSPFREQRTRAPD